MIQTGLDRLLAAPDRLRELAGTRYGLLAHGAAVTGDLRPIHRALAASAAGPPHALFGPEHGFYGIEQDMVAAAGGRDPWTGAPIESLYGDAAETLAPRPETFTRLALDLLIIDLQDVGSRYYTYAATAVWAAEAALAAGCEVWVLDRPNPLGGEVIEGNLPAPGCESFVGAFRLPVRHALTLGELMLLEARRRGWRQAPRVWTLDGWRRAMSWSETGLAWIAPSPNMPTAATALIYPGGCLIEATELSEGRGTTRPFHLAGAPGVDPAALADALNAHGAMRAGTAGAAGKAGAAAGCVFLPVYFRPQFQKHRGQVCGGVQLEVTEPAAFRSYRTGVELLRAFARIAPRAFGWRRAAYEFVTDRPAIDLLTGGSECRTALDRGDDGALDAWMATWAADEASFRAERREILLYPESPALPPRDPA